MRIRNLGITYTIRLFVLGGAIVLLPFFLLAQIPYQTGWPVEVNGYRTSSATIADVDSDDENEIIISDAQPGGSPLVAKLYIYSTDGNLKSGWPIEAISSYNAPALADLDNDGTLEIISIYAGLHVYKYDGALVWEHLYSGPIFQSAYAPSQVSVDDLDSDGQLEIIITCGTGGAVFVFEPDGTVRPGWPVLITPVAPMYKAASIGDIDQDGIKEIVFGADNHNVYCLKPDGSNCVGFPVDLGTGGYRSQGILADIDADGYLEIMVGKLDAKFRVLNHDGTLFPGYPINQQNSNFSIGDMDSDGQLEVFIPYGPIYGYDLQTATLLPNFPFTDPSGVFSFSGYFGPNIADLSTYSEKEMAAGSSSAGFVPDGRLFAFESDGQVVSGFPSDLLFHRGLSNGCTVNDLDNDGDIEICCGSENMEFSVPRTSTVFCWDIDHPYNLDNIDWAMDGFDLGHTGRWRKLYHIDKVNSSLAVEGCTSSPCMLVPDGSLKEVTITATRQADGTHPTGQDVRLSRTLGCGEYEGPVVDNGDGTYTRMLRLPDGTECTSDIHARVNEFKLEEGVRINFFSCLEDLGDVNGNGAISAFDASLALMDVVGMITLDDAAMCRADVNQNFKVTSLDAAYILMCVVGNCASLPTSQFQASCASHGNCF